MTAALISRNFGYLVDRMKSIHYYMFSKTQIGSYLFCKVQSIFVCCHILDHQLLFRLYKVNVFLYDCKVQVVYLLCFKLSCILVALYSWSFSNSLDCVFGKIQIVYGSVFFNLQHSENCHNHPKTILLVQYGHSILFQC